MSEQTLIPVASLLIDEENPRLSQPNAGQREALRSLASYQGRKLQALAKDILAYGPDPSELPIVMPFDEDQAQYVVLDGNRRLTALRALENPELFVDAVPRGVLAELRRMSREYQQSPIDSLFCLVVPDREDGRHWIELRHTGEREGAGSVPWGSEEAARFRARSEGLDLHIQALDFLQRRGDITPEFRRQIPATNLERLLGAPDVRSKLGIELQNNKMKILADEESVARAILHVANDLQSGRIRVGDIYSRDQRTAYANSLATDVVVTPTRSPGQGVDVSAGTQEGTTSQTTRAINVQRPRDKLIPRDCRLNVTDPRVKTIERELRLLSLDTFGNAVSVLLRVFIELSVDAHIERHGVSTPVDTSLATKLREVMNDLVSRQKITSQQATPVRRALQRDSFLAPSITLMHSWVHNQHMFPGPSDLRANWDNLQPFIKAIWAP